MPKSLRQFDDNKQQKLNRQKCSIDKDKSWYITIIPFENGNSSLSIFIQMLFSIGITYISLLYAQLVFYPEIQQQNEIIGKIITFTKEHIQIQILLITLAYSLAITAILIILFVHIKLVSQKSFLYSIIQPLAGILPLLPLLGTFLGSISIMFETYFIPKLISLIITSAITIFINTFLQCSNNTDDLLYSYNNFFLIMVRYITSIHHILCALEYRLQSIYIIQWVSLAAFIVGMYYYCKKGFRSYRHRISQICLLIRTAQFLASSICIFAMPFSNLKLGQPLLISVVLTIILSLITSKVELNLISKQNFTIEQMKLFTEIYNNGNDGLQIQQITFLKGLMISHSYLCNNPSCFSKKSNVFCPSLQTSINSSLKEDDSKFESLFLYYIKCLYQTLMVNQRSNCEIVLSYCEFLCYQMKILLPIHPYLHYLLSSKLSSDQQYRIYHLLRAVQKKMKHIMIGVKDLQLEKVIIIQQLNDSLLQIVKAYLRFNCRFWMFCQKKYQPKYKILQWTHKQYQMLQIINKKMEEAKQYFHVNPKLKRIYSFFQIFLNNYPKKQRHQSLLQKILFKSSQQISLLPFQQLKSQKIALTSIFDSNSIIINTQFADDQLLIRQMSKSSMNIIGYSQQQLIYCNINIILPNYLSHHSDLFKKWSQYGQINHEKTLNQTKCHCLNKENRLLQVNKQYKTYIDVEGTIRFVCLLELSNIQPAILICPQNILLNEQPQSSQNFYQYSKFLYDYLNLKNITNHNEYFVQILKTLTKQQLLKNRQIIKQIQGEKYNGQVSVDRIRYSQKYSYYIINFATGITSSYHKTQLDSHKQDTLKINDHKLQQRNIFTKQQIYQPVQSTTQTTIVSRLPCIYNILITILILISTLISFERYSQLQIFIDRQVFIIRLQKHPYMLGINYYKAIMQIDDQQELDQVIEHYSQQLLKQIANQLFLLSYFDPEIFVNQTITIHRQEQQITYKSKDIIFILASFASTFNRYHSEYDENQYYTYNQVLLPFFTMMKDIKQSLFSKYNTLFTKIYLTNIIFLTVFIISQIIVIIILILCFRASKKKLFQVLRIIVDHRQQQIIAIKHYWRNLIEFYDQTFATNPQQQKYDKNEQLNNAEIQINNLQQTQLPNLSKAMIITIVSLFFQLSILISTQYSSFYTAIKIQQFQHEIQPILNFFPSGDVISYYILQKRYNQSVLHNNITNSDGFTVSLKQLQTIKRIQYLSQAADPSSPFYQSFKNFFFDNPCLRSPQVFIQQGISDWECHNFQQGKLASGLGVFTNYIFERVTDYIDSQLIMQDEEINGFTQSLTTMNAYLQQLIKIWLIQCKSKFSSAKSKLLYYNSFLILTLITIYIAIIKIYLIPKLAVIETLYKEVYRNFVTKQEISNSKIMQSQLRTLGFINKL